jgi:hypothetical protein
VIDSGRNGSRIVDESYRKTSVSKFWVAVEVKERSKAFDLASVRGKRIVWSVARVSRAKVRGNAPLLDNLRYVHDFPVDSLTI